LTGASVVDSVPVETAVPLETAALLQVDAPPAVAVPEAVLLKWQFKHTLQIVISASFPRK